MFILFILLLIFTIPIHFLSIEHTKLIKKYGNERGEKYGEILGIISGYGHFFLCFGIWFSPQPSFLISSFLGIIKIPIFNISIPIIHIFISLPLIIAFVVIENIAVKAVSMKTAMTHSAEKLIFSGIYSIIRHPQHLGQLFLYIGMTVLFSRLYSLFFLPIYIIIILILSKKEENQLIIEFGEDYKKYMDRVPLLIPKMKIKKSKW